MKFFYRPSKNNKLLLASENSVSIHQTLANEQDQYMSFKNDPNISNSRCNINCETLLQYVEAKFQAKFRLKVSATKTVLNPTINEGKVTATGSSKYVLGPDNYTVVPGSINNIITQIKVATGQQTYLYNNAVEDNQRILKNKICMMQYNQDKLNNEFKLHVDKDIEDCVEYNSIIGIGNTSSDESQSNNTSIPKYLLISAPAKQYNDTRAGYKSAFLSAEISNIQLIISGKKAVNVLEFITMRDLEQMTADVLHNDKKWYKYLDSSYRHTLPAITSCLLEPNNAIPASTFNSSKGPIFALDGTGYTPTRRQKLNFFILDLTKISLGTIDGVPLVPGVMYSTPFQYKVICNINKQLSVQDYEQYTLTNDLSYDCIPLCIPINPMLGRVNNSGNFEMVELLQSYDNFASQYTEILDNYHHVVDEKILLGGKIADGFFGDLWDDIKSGVSDVANVVKKAIPFVSQALPVVEQVASHLGGDGQSRKNKLFKRYI